MSLTGSIGSMLQGSGLETVHGPNAVAQMISGKAVSRALCEHFLVEAALVNELMLTVLPCQEEKANHSVVEHTEGEDSNDHGTSSESTTPEIDTRISSEHKLDAGEVQEKT